MSSASYIASYTDEDVKRVACDECVIFGDHSEHIGTTIAVTILALSKHKTDTHIQFIDASGLFKKETNILTDAHIEEIIGIFDSKADSDHFAKSVSCESIVAEIEGGAISR